MADSKIQVPGKKSGGTNYPRNFQPIVFDGYQGLNTKPARMAIADQEMAWCDNFMPLGKNNLRTLYDIGVAVYTVQVTTWNPNDKGASVVLSGGDLIASFITQNAAGVRATTSKNAGNYYFEAIHGGVSTTVGAIGIASNAATLAGALGNDANGYGIFPSGQVITAGSGYATVSSYSLGDVVGIAVSASTQMMWQRVNGGMWNANASANPAAGIGGISVAGIKDYFPMSTGSGASTTTFDPNALPPGQALSSNNLTASYISAAQIVQTTAAYSSGLYYFEGTMNFSSPSNANKFGVMSYLCDRTQANADFTLPVPAYITPAGKLFANNVARADFSAISSGSVVRWALNVNALTMWVSINGGPWNTLTSSNPSTAVGGISIGPTTPPVMVMAAVSGVHDSITLNAGATNFAYSVPNGFNVGLPANYGIWPSFPAFDPNNVAGPGYVPDLITLSSGNHTATCSVSTGTENPCAVVLGPGRSTGKFYVEFTIGNSWNSSSSVGVFAQDNGLTNFLGVTGKMSAGFRGAGTAEFNNSSIGTAATYSSGALVCVALDLTDKTIWSRVGANGLWNNMTSGNPTTNTAGFSVSGLMTPVNIAISTHAVLDAVTVNCGDSAFIGIAPSGYEGFWNGPTSSTGVTEIWTGNFGTSGYAYPAPIGFGAWNPPST